MKWNWMAKWRKILAVFLAALLVAALGTGGFFWWLLHRTPGQTFDSNGVPIYYTDEGRGEPIVLVHGVAANADLNWRRPGVTRMLAKEFRVIALDLRGHGRSGKPENPEQYGSELYEDIVRLMDHLGIEKVHVAGYSLGGFLALKLAVTHPDRLESVAICSSGWADPASKPDIPNPYQAPKEAKAPIVLAASAVPEGLFGGLVHSVRNKIGDMILPNKVKKALKASYYQIGVEAAALEANSIPALSVIGTADGLLPWARALKAHMANLEYVEIPGGDHLWTPTNKTFQKTLLDFFRKHSQTGKGS